MDPLRVAGQIVGLFGAALTILSFQFKRNKVLFTVQVCSTALFTLHYLLLGLGGDQGAFAGMAQNFGGLLLRVALLLTLKFPRIKSPLTLSLLCAYCAVTAALTYTGSWISLLPLCGNIIGMGAMWTQNKDVLRIEQLTVTSPCWLIYNISTMSVSGVITEIFNIISVIVYYIRMKVSAKHEKS